MQTDISKKNWLLIWVLGLAGQLCWNVENAWFSTFVYNKIAPDLVFHPGATLKAGIEASAIHGNKSPNARTRALPRTQQNRSTR